MENTKKIKRDLKNILSGYRYQHSLMVADSAKKLARRYNIDKDKAYIAGLLHDIAKEFSDEVNEDWIKRYNLSENFKEGLHAEIGALYIKEKYNFDDDICNAIKYHTICNTNMNTFEKIIFIADKIGRKNKDERIKKLEALAYRNLDEAVRFHLTNLKEKFKEEGKQMHPTTLQLLEELDKKR